MKADTSIRKKCLRDGCTTKPLNPNEDYCAKHRSKKKKMNTTQEELNKLSSDLGIVKVGGRNRSHFIVTISPNRSADNDKDKELFSQALSYLYSDEQIKDFFKDKQGKPLSLHATIINSGPIEIGDKHNLLNHHANIYVEHDNLLQIDVHKLREFLTEIFGHGVHLNVQTPKSNEMTELSKMNNYAFKEKSNY